MKRKIFDRGLYLDSLRRTAVIGGLFTVLLTIAALLVFFAYTVDLQYIDLANLTVRTLNFLEIHPIVLVTPFLLTPLLCLNLFGFLNKRSTSDFWHSVPFTRVCLYNTFSIAALTWALVAIAVSAAVSLACFSALPVYFAINWMSVLTSLLSVVAATALVQAGFLVAMSITGTYFSNVVVAVLILFLPRVLMLFFSYTSANTTLFEVSMDSSILAPSYNIVAGMILDLDNVPEFINSWRSIIYTAVLSIAYYALGLGLFHFRKSEAASNSAVNRYMQATFRIIVCLTVCLVPIYLISEELNGGGNHYSNDDWFAILVLYVIAAAAYFIYELITTKKLKNLVRAVPGLGIVLLLNLLLIGGSHIAYRVEYDYTPTPETVSQIKLSSPDSYNAYYFESAVAQTEIADNEIEQILCDSYIRTRSRYETGYLRSDGYEVITVGFKTNGFYRYRNIWIETEDYEKLTELLHNNEDFKDIYDIESIFQKAIGTDCSINLPFHYTTDDGTVTYQVVDKDALIAAYIEDVKALDFYDWFSIANSNSYNQVELYTGSKDQKVAYVVGSIEGSIPLGGTNAYFRLPISNFTPKSFNMIMEAVMQNQQQRGAEDEILGILTNPEFPTVEDPEMLGKYYDISVELYNGVSMNNSEYYVVDTEDKAANLGAIFASTKGQIPDHGSRFAVVYYHKLVDPDAYIYESNSAVFKVPDDANLTFLLGTDLGSLESAVIID